ncbi:hypothetical protein RchiOBHm_Chr5g0020021 [Rosa chinensis]|uniref:Uncharacterized protein n=1 Tax=Rosa chinensis TaxID=74649 RepID=A0A2P6Q781_ROSCH|nr:hypothetical protein RchiOBHm_Chr5g0020021 [Rosa chinensis]
MALSFSNSKFCDSHTLRNPNSNLSALIWRKDSYASDSTFVVDPSGSHPPKPLGFGFLPNPDVTDMLQSCNGLILCNHFDGTSYFYLVNPTTSSYLLLLPFELDVRRLVCHFGF